MKEELYLLTKLANSSTTRFTESHIYSLNNGVADIDDLLDQGYIRLERMMTQGKDEKYYKIGIKGWELLNTLKKEKVQNKIIKINLLISFVLLLLTIIGLFISIF